MAAAYKAEESVLLVDDDPIVRELLTMLLGAEGYRVAAAESLPEALFVLSTNSVLSTTRPQVVLTDLNIPGTKAEDLVSQLRARTGSDELLLGMSATPPDESVRKHLHGFLQKPFGVAEFVEAVKTAKRRAKPELSGQSEMAEEVSGAAVLDRVIYERLAAALPPEKLRELYSLTLDDVGKRVETIGTAFAAGDTAICRSEAHAIKGGCGMVGAAELRTLAASIEAGSPADTSALAEIAAACTRLRRMLDTLP